MSTASKPTFFMGRKNIQGSDNLASTKGDLFVAIDEVNAVHAQVEQMAIAVKKYHGVAEARQYASDAQAKEVESKMDTIAFALQSQSREIIQLKRSVQESRSSTMIVCGTFALVVSLGIGLLVTRFSIPNQAPVTQSQGVGG